MPLTWVVYVKRKIIDMSSTGEKHGRDAAICIEKRRVILIIIFTAVCEGRASKGYRFIPHTFRTITPD